MSATGRKRTPSNGPDGEADEGAGLDGGDQLEAGGEGLLAGLVAEPAAREQGSGGAAEEGEAEKVGFGHAPPAGDRAPFVLPEADNRPDVDREQRDERDGDRFHAITLAHSRLETLYRCRRAPGWKLPPNIRRHRPYIKAALVAI